MFERMLVGKIENRVTVGIVCFVGMMVLLGWAAINEGGRMASLEETFHARSIEQGAALFANNCTTCHGADGRGLAGYAPGLNNPAFFGHDFFPEITSQVNTLRAEEAALVAERDSLEVPVTEERRAEIVARLAEISSEIDSLSGERSSQVDAAVQLGYDPARPARLQNVGWVGTHNAFVLTTLIHGRPVSINYWQNGAMPAWSQTAGGSLRMDQLEDLVAYVENWDKGDGWTLEDLFAVRQFAIEPVQPGTVTGPTVDPVGTDVVTILTDLEGITGDPVRGEQLYHNQARSELGQSLACTGCHIQTTNGTGPMADHTFWRTENIRLQDPALSNLTADEYLVQSILQPGAYVVPGFQNLMLANFGQRISLQDLADLLAYIHTLNTPQE
jgi:mono/diheme cytochrome c family protein